LNNPSGLRIGVQEMTRFGMKEPEMERIAGLVRECIIDGKTVKEEVNRFRAEFTDIHFSFDPAGVALPQGDIARS
jgi:glycine hydroxymethyltransferase